MRSAHRPATTRSDARSFGERFRERLRISSWCLTSTDSATTERAPPGRTSRALSPADAEKARRDRAPLNPSKVAAGEKSSRILEFAIHTVVSGIRAAFVYGSVAKATDQASSDIDLMVVSDSLTYGDVFGVLDGVSRTLRRHVNPTVYSAAEFSKRAKDENAFVTRVLEGPKVWVIGAEHDLPVAA